jgi:signal transduction histidine kinase
MNSHYSEDKIFDALYQDEALRGEKLAYYFRWLLVCAIFFLITALYFDDRKEEALVSSIPLVAFTLYNLFIYLILQKKKTGKLIHYLSVCIDISLLSAHIYTMSVLFYPTAIYSSASIFIYFILIFLASLRHDRRLIIFATFYTLICFNLVFFLRHGSVDIHLRNQILSADLSGQFFKSIYLVIFGFLLISIPQLVRRLITKVQSIEESRQKSELILALEQQKNQFTIEKLAYEQRLNAELQEQKHQIESQLEQLNELNHTKDKMLSVIGHDLKNPFTAIQSLVSLLHHDYEELNDEEKREIIFTVYNASHKSLHLLENLLHWARSHSGRFKPVIKNFYLNKVIEDAKDVLAHQASQKDIMIINEIPPDLLIASDENMLQAVFRNIIGNGIKFTNTGGFIRITAAEMNKCCAILFSDNGVGMTKEKISVLFDGRKCESTTGTAQEKGAGLGLVICKEFMEKLNGTITVRNNPDRGCTFTITLPLNDADRLSETEENLNPLLK